MVDRTGGSGGAGVAGGEDASADRGLAEVVAELERHVAGSGWDQPPRLFALAGTADLLRAEPQLAAQLAGGDGAATAGPLTPIEQEELPEFASLEELLGGIAWPAEVLGAAIVVERVLLPPEVEAQMPADQVEALTWAAAHPRREEVRVSVGVLRDGARAAALRLRSAASPDGGDVVTGPDLLPGLAEALAATFAE